MKLYCTHDECRADVLDDIEHLSPLLRHALKLRDVDIKEMRSDVMRGVVVCRKVPRGHAPLPGEDLSYGC